MTARVQALFPRHSIRLDDTASVATYLGSAMLAVGTAFAAANWPILSIGAIAVLVFAGVALAKPVVALLGLAASLPWEDMLAYPTSFFTIVKALGLVLMGASALALLRGSTRLRVAKRPTVAVLVLLMSVAVSLAASTDPSDGIVKSLSFVGYALFFFVVVQFLDSWDRLLRFVSVLAMSTALAAAYGLVRFLSGAVSLASGPIGNANDFAFLLAAFLPFQIEMAFRQPRARALWFGAFTITLAGLVATFSRGALVGLAVAGLWLLLSGRIRVAAILGFLLVGATVVAIGITFASNAVTQPFQAKQSFGAKTATARQAYWSAALQLGMFHPLTGIGPNRFRSVGGSYILDNPVPIEKGAVVHNSYLELFVESGVVALGAFVAFLFSTWRLLTRLERRELAAGNTQVRRFVTAVKAGMLSAAVGGSFISVQLHTPFWVLGAIACAASLMPTRTVAGTGRTSSDLLRRRFPTPPSAKSLGSRPRPDGLDAARMGRPPSRYPSKKLTPGRGVPGCFAARVSHVAMIVTLPGGGPVEQALLLAEGLVRRGVRVRTITSYDDVSARFLSVGASVTVAPFRHWLHPSAVSILRRGMSGAEVVHAHDRRAALWMRILPRPHRHTCRVHTAHGIADVFLPSDARPRKPKLRDHIAYRAVDPLLASRTDAIIVPSHAVARDLITRFRYPKARVIVVPNGVDVTRPPHFGDPGGRVITLSALERYKGLDIYLRAVAKVAARRPDVRFAMYGTGSQADALDRLCDELGIAEVVLRPGFVNADHALAEARLLVMSSRWENAPIALLEAMASGVPVVTTDVYGIPEIATSATAQITAADDPGALADAILRTLDDPDAARQQAIAARRRVEAHFSAQANTEQVLALYERLNVARLAGSPST